VDFCCPGTGVWVYDMWVGGSVVPSPLTPLIPVKWSLPMNPNTWSGVATRFIVIVIAVLMFTAYASAAWKESVLHSFQGGSDGYQPAGGVVFDKAGNLYGANSWGGSGGCVSPGCGTVFEISPPSNNGGSWPETRTGLING